MSRLLGAVLTGGASRRMGRDKATIEVEGIAMVDRLAEVLGALCASVVAIGPPSLAGRLPAVVDRFPGDGPLGGVITALRYATPVDEAEDAYDAVVIVACDLPWLDRKTIETVVAAFAVGIDVAVAGAERIEPMCAVWDPGIAPELERMFADGERAVHRAMTGLRVRVVQVDPAPLRNVNTPDDLATE